MKSPWLVVALSLLTATLFASTPTPGKSETALDTAYTENPNAYIYGTIADGTSIFERQAGLNGMMMAATNIRFQPSHTYLLYTEAVLFCGDWTDTFNQMGGVLIVVTYKKHARRLVQGVPCHDLISVDYVATKADVDAARKHK